MYDLKRLLKARAAQGAPSIWWPASVRVGRRLAAGMVLVAGVVLVASLSGCVSGRAQAGSALAELGKPAPEFELRAVGTDQSFRLRDLRGKPVILTFFCGCRPCFELSHAWDRSREKWRSAQMLGIMHNIETYNPSFVRHFREGTRFDAPILADVSSRVSIQYRSLDCPMVWVIDREGIVRFRSKDRLDPPEQIVAGVIRALEKL